MNIYYTCVLPSYACINTHMLLYNTQKSPSPLGDTFLLSLRRLAASRLGVGGGRRLQSHEPSIQPSRHRWFTSAQSNTGLPIFRLTLLWKRHSHCDRAVCEVALTGSTVSLRRKRNDSINDSDEITKTKKINKIFSLSKVVQLQPGILLSLN